MAMDRQARSRAVLINLTLASSLTGQPSGLLIETLDDFVQVVCVVSYK